MDWLLIVVIKVLLLYTQEIAGLQFLDTERLEKYIHNKVYTYYFTYKGEIF